MACVGPRITVLASRLAFRGAFSSPSLTRALTSPIAMPPKASAAGKTTQQGLGAFLQKGVKMVEHIKVDVPKAFAENGDKSAAGTRTSGRKRTTKAEADAKAAAKAAKKPKKAGPSRDAERRCWSAGKKIVCGADEAGRGPPAASARGRDGGPCAAAPPRPGWVPPTTAGRIWA